MSRGRVQRSAETLGELAERWRPWRALAATHLWLADGPERPLVERVDAA